MAGSPETDSRSVRLLRFAAAAAGLLLILAALLSDIVGLSVNREFSSNQITIIILGVCLFAAAILGRKTPQVYRGIAIMLLNTILILVLADLAALLVLKVWNPDDISTRVAKLNEVRSGRSTAPDINSIRGHYTSFLLWHADPGLAGMMSSDERGLRTTPGAVEQEGSFDVFVFGGSAAWGVEVPDSCTIAAYIQEFLSEELDRPVNVVNYGQISWVSSQELICLLFELRDGMRPELVIFHDGFNDLHSAYQCGRAGEHYAFLETRDWMENSGRLEAGGNVGPADLFDQTNLGLLARLARRSELFSPPLPAVSYATMGIDAQSMAGRTFTHYQRTMDAASVLGEAYGFECLFCWQPVIWCSEKPLTEREEMLRAGGLERFPEGGDPSWLELVAATSERVRSNADTMTAFVDLSNVFDGTDAEIFTDAAGCHVNAAGNRIIAGAIVDSLRSVDFEGASGTGSLLQGDDTPASD